MAAHQEALIGTQIAALEALASEELVALDRVDPGRHHERHQSHDRRSDAPDPPL